MWRVVLGVGRPLLAALAVAVAGTAYAALPSVTLRLVAQNLSSPLELVNADDGSNRLFIVQQGGQVKILENGSVLATPFLDVSGLIASGGEQGLLGLAFHPDFETNRALYVFYTRSADGALTIARYLRHAANPDIADAASGAVLLTIPHPGHTNHNGGRIAFGPDGYLYIGTGDGGGGGDPDANGLDRSVRLGKILRIAVDGGAGYTIPPTNPYAGSSCGAGTCPEIWAYGLRNPWKFSFDVMTGDLFIADVGQDAIEEVNWQLASSGGNANYGWGVYEGNNCYDDSYFGSPGACAALAGHTRPVLTYSHNSSGGFSITGGYRYRGSNAALKGYYIYGDYVSRRVWAARPDRFGAWKTEVLLTPAANAASSISSFGEDESGEAYLVDLSGGRIYAIDGPPLLAVASRKTHAALGDVDLDLDTSRAAGDFVTVEPRLPASGAHLVVFKFSVPVSSAGTATCVDENGAAVGTVATSLGPGEVRVTLNSVPAVQRVQVSLTNVNGAAINVTASLGFLAGDVDGSGAVTASDILRTKGWDGLPASAGNFRHDVDLSSGINSLDVSEVKARSGLSL